MSGNCSTASPTVWALVAATTTIALGMLAFHKQRQRQQQRPAPRRFGAAIKLKPDLYRRYRELHDDVWEAVLQRMFDSNIRNFTIYYHKETSTMFQHFEWIGHWENPGLSPDEEQALFQADMQAIADDPVTRKWWKECEPCQEPFSQWKRGATAPSDGGAGDWWAPLECVNHCGYWPTSYSAHNRDPNFVKVQP